MVLDSGFYKRKYVQSMGSEMQGVVVIVKGPTKQIGADIQALRTERSESCRQLVCEIASPNLLRSMESYPCHSDIRGVLPVRVTLALDANPNDCLARLLHAGTTTIFRQGVCEEKSSKKFVLLQRLTSLSFCYLY